MRYWRMVRKGTYATVHGWTPEYRPSRWRSMIQSEEDDRWHLVTNGVEYGLQHNCQKHLNSITNNPAGCDYSGYERYACAYCRTEAPAGLMAILKLHAFGMKS